jgi:hypothetical protein
MASDGGGGDEGGSSWWGSLVKTAKEKVRHSPNFYLVFFRINLISIFV